VTALPRRLLAEAVGTALLLAVVVGSGIMGQRLSGGNDAMALLANAAATAAALYVLITLFAPLSGAQFNPAVTLALWQRGDIDASTAVAYVLVQCAAAVLGVLLAHAMFDLPLLQPGLQMRTGLAQWLSEAVATAGLLLTILLASRQRAAAIPALVASYVFAAYWFTASTAFANPAVTLARALTQTFAGIRPADVAAFIAAQLLGTAVAVCLARLLAGAPAAAVIAPAADPRIGTPAP
jgi:glycerol uptake facilitator-like aquaporin